MSVENTDKVDRDARGAKSPRAEAVKPLRAQPFGPGTRAAELLLEMRKAMLERAVDDLVEVMIAEQKSVE